MIKSGIRNPEGHVQKHQNLRKLQEIRVEIPDIAAMSSQSAFAVYTKAGKVNGNATKKASKKKRSAEKVMEAETIKKEAKLINKLAGGGGGGETQSSKKKLDKKRKKSTTKVKNGAVDESYTSEVDAFANSLRKTGEGKTVGVDRITKPGIREFRIFSWLRNRIPKFDIRIFRKIRPCQRI